MNQQAIPARAQVDHFADVGKMVRHRMSGHLTGRFRLGDDIQEVVPFGVPQQVLQVPRQPEFDAAVGLLGMTFEGFSQRMHQVCSHHLLP